MWAEAEVLDSFTGVLWSTEENDVRAGWSTHGELIESETLTTRLQNASTCSGGEAKRADGHLWNLVQAVVVRDGRNNCTDLSLIPLRGVLVRACGNDLGERERRAVDLGGHQATAYCLVEGAVGCAASELEKV